MKVILLADVKGTGKREQVLEVSDGYARNYLLPRKLAVQASADAINTIKNAKAAEEHRQTQQRQATLELARQMKEYGEGRGLSIRVQREDIFDAMHQI